MIKICGYNGRNIKSVLLNKRISVQVVFQENGKPKLTSEEKELAKLKKKMCWIELENEILK